MAERGKYIVIEGPDGTGKTTQAHKLVETLETRGQKSRYIHEPGETAIGLELEKIIKNRTIGRSVLSDLLLFTVNRLEVYEQVIEPALHEGEFVIADRNWLSSIAYQGVAGGLGVAAVREVTQKFLPDEYINPDFTALLYLSDERREAMLGSRGTSDGDYFETQPSEFQEKLEEGYRQAVMLGSGNRYMPSKHISADGSIDEVHARIVSTLEEGHVIPRGE